MQLTHSKSKLLETASKNKLKGVKIIDEKLVSIATKNSKVIWDKPTIVGSATLDLAKCFMFQFHYQTMKENMKCKLLYSEADSFLYEIETKDLYQDLAFNSELRKQFDFSNYEEGHSLFSNAQKKETLKFKDEMTGKIVKGLSKPKTLLNSYRR